MRLVAFVRDSSLFEDGVPETALLGAVSSSGEYRIIKDTENRYTLGDFTPILDNGEFNYDIPRFFISPHPVVDSTTFLDSDPASRFVINLDSIEAVYTTAVEGDSHYVCLCDVPFAEIGTDYDFVSIVSEDRAPHFTLAQ